MSDPIKTTPLQMSVWIVIAWVVGMLAGSLATRLIWERRVVDLQTDLDEQYRNIELLDTLYLEAADEVIELKARALIDQAPQDIEDPEIIDEECGYYTFRETAALIEEAADFVKMALMEMDAARNLLICARMDRGYLLDIFSWTNDAMRALEFALGDLQPDWRERPLQWMDPELVPGYPGVRDVPSS